MPLGCIIEIENNRTLDLRNEVNRIALCDKPQPKGYSLTKLAVESRKRIISEAFLSECD